MHSKSVTPLQAEPGASRVFVSACSEGAGHHGLFLFVGAPRRQCPLHLARTVAAGSGAVPAMVVARLRTRWTGRAVARPPPPAQPIWLYVPGPSAAGRPAETPGMTALGTWPEVLARIAAEQGHRPDLEVAVYPCAPLQSSGAPGRRAAAGRDVGGLRHLPLRGGRRLAYTTAVLAFVISNGRSGSTLVHELLARHPEVGFISNLEDRIPGLPAGVGRFNSSEYRRVPTALIRKGRLRYAPLGDWRALVRKVFPMLIRSPRDLLADPPTRVKQLLSFAGLAPQPVFDAALARTPFRTDRVDAYRAVLGPRRWSQPSVPR